MSRQTFHLTILTLWLVSSSMFGQDDVEPRRLPPIEPASATADTVEESVNSTATDPGASEPSPNISPEEIEAVEAEVLADLEPTSTWQTWLVPTYWNMPADWQSSFELGIDGSEGNASTLTFRTGANLRRQVDWSDLTLDITYVKSLAERVETRHNAQLEANHDWLLGESPWSLFGKTILVYDEFRPFDLELTLNAGVGYRLIDNDTWLLKGRFGSGATRQWDGPEESWRPEAMLGADFRYEISARQRLRLTCEYFPEWGNFEVYRIRTDAGWELLLDQATNMSLKLGIIDRYDSNAGGTRPNALDYSLLLLWKL